jgi:hypothetical protein
MGVQHAVAVGSSEQYFLFHRFFINTQFTKQVTYGDRQHICFSFKKIELSSLAGEIPITIFRFPRLPSVVFPLLWSLLSLEELPNRPKGLPTSE